jgi:hypothetical protein
MKQLKNRREEKRKEKKRRKTRYGGKSGERYSRELP